jgi:hypothetical protein
VSPTARARSSKRVAGPDELLGAARLSHFVTARWLRRCNAQHKSALSARPTMRHSGVGKFTAPRTHPYRRSSGQIDRLLGYLVNPVDVLSNRGCLGRGHFHFEGQINRTIKPASPAADRWLGIDWRTNGPATICCHRCVSPRRYAPQRQRCGKQASAARISARATSSTEVEVDCLDKRSEHACDV